MPPAQLSASFQSLPLLPTSKLGPSGADSWVCGLVYVLGPCGSPVNSPVRPRVSPATATPTGFYQTFWSFISPHWNQGLCSLSGSLVVPPSLPTRKCGTAQSSSHSLAVSPLYLAAHLCPSYQPGWMFFVYHLVVGLLYSSIFWQFWLLFVFKFVVVLLMIVWGGKVYLPTPPSWPEVPFLSL